MSRILFTRGGGVCSGGLLCVNGNGAFDAQNGSRGVSSSLTQCSTFMVTLRVNRALLESIIMLWEYPDTARLRFSTDDISVR